jgi:DNA polymerase III subunit delta'
MSFTTSAEPDRLPTAPHPRDTARLFGHAEQEAAFMEALKSRMHHAWLLGGPQGIGKATFAWRAARFMLSQADPLAAAHSTSLDIAPDNHATRKISAGAHADLAVLRRIVKPDGKSVTANIPVESVRRTLDMFGTTAAAGGWRVCIVDSTEDLERASALLKVLEEPPPKCLFLIVSHAPGRLLPTIRSRCRLLRFRPLDERDVVLAATQALTAAGRPPTEADMRRVARLAQGSIRKALVLIDPETLALVDTVRARLDALPQIDLGALLALGEDVAGRAGEADFATVLETIQDWLSGYLATHVTAGPARLAPLAEVWDNLAQRAREAETYNLDRRPLILSMFQDLSVAVRRSRAA